MKKNNYPKKEKTLTKEQKDKVVDYLFEEFIESLSGRHAEHYDKIKEVFDYAREKHKMQFRKTGQELPFIVHPLAVAKIIATEMGFGPTSISAALLHDVVEDTPTPIEEIAEKFGDDVATIVDGVTKITDSFNPKITKQAETFKELILKMSKDRRIAFVKIADRLHNLRTLDGIQENSQMIKTAESLTVYAPLAHQLGLFNVRKEIEDLSFKYREPIEYKRVSKIIKKNKEARLMQFFKLSEPISKIMKEANYDFKIKPVTKSAYKIREILVNKKIDFSSIDNYLSVRIILKNLNNDFSEKQHCYLLYTLLTDHFAVKDDALRDWITAPRRNGFEALIAKIMLEGSWIEVQIMTDRMNQIAERGYARHHENIHLNNVEKWVRSAGKALKNKNLTSEEILEYIKPESSEIQAFTPTGEIITLNKNSTVLDFAFAIHTYLGLHFIAAEVNNKLADFNHILKTGDVVKIITSDTKIPEKEWYSAVTQQRNKDELDKFFRKQHQKVIDDGETIFKHTIFELNKEESEISKLINHFKCKNKNDFFEKISLNIISSEAIKIFLTRRTKLFGFIPWNTSDENEHEEIRNNSLKFDSKKLFIIDNLSSVKLATCCKPIDGDSAIVHYNNNEFTIHRKKCPNASKLNASDGKNTAAVKWMLPPKDVHTVKIRFNGIDRKLLLSDILQIISDEMNTNMVALVIKAENNVFRGTIKLKVRNSKDLNTLIIKISKIQGIKKVYRA